jgi:hypothetical protein
MMIDFNSMYSQRAIFFVLDRNIAGAVQQFTLPEFSVSTLDIANGSVRNAQIPDNVIMGQSVTLTLMLDSKFKLWRELVAWLKEMPTQDYMQKLHDVVISVVDNMNAETTKIVLTSAWPTNISAISYDTTSMDAVASTVELTLAFNDILIKETPNAN